MKTLVACPSCSAQYDVSVCKPDEMLHCSCGHMLSRTKPVLHEGRVIKCSNCGGSVKKGDANCAYCSTSLSMSDKGWGSMCPKCYVRLPEEANYCVTCGIGIHAQKLTGKESTLKCPRCDCLLKTRQMDSLSVAECGTCGGLWTPIESFEAIVSKKKEVKTSAKGMLGPRRQKRVRFEISTQEKVKYIGCPQCQDIMNRRNFGQNSGVIIDTCREHGVWLDNQELSQIVKYMEDGGADQATLHQATQRTIAPYEPLSKAEIKSMQRTWRSPGMADVLWTVLRFLS